LTVKVFDQQFDVCKVPFVALSSLFSLFALAWARRRRRMASSACSGGCKRSWIIYCWLVWCERKILFWLEIYNRLRPSEQAYVCKVSFIAYCSLKLVLLLAYSVV